MNRQRFLRKSIAFIGNWLLSIVAAVITALASFLFGWALMAIAVLVAGGDVPTPLAWWNDFNTDNLDNPVLLALAFVGIFFSFIGKYAVYFCALIGLILNIATSRENDDEPSVIVDQGDSRIGENICRKCNKLSVGTWYEVTAAELCSDVEGQTQSGHIMTQKIYRILGTGRAFLCEDCTSKDILYFNWPVFLQSVAVPVVFVGSLLFTNFFDPENLDSIFLKDLFSFVHSHSQAILVIASIWAIIALGLGSHTAEAGNKESLERYAGHLIRHELKSRFSTRGALVTLTTDEVKALK